MAPLSEVKFIKGHGTGNDFILVPDLEGTLELGPAQVRFLADRHTGLGADGVIRVVRTARVAEVAHLADQAEWFMDYRNADGSIAEMCGNGARVFVRFLDATGLITDDEVFIATRAGALRVTMHRDLSITIDMGPARSLDSDGGTVSVSGHTWPIVAVAMPNPHAIAWVEDLEHAGDLAQAPSIAMTQAFPDGANVEFAVKRGIDHVAMRVFERGVGETLSCGTGACAVAWAALRADAAMPGTGRTVRVDVPGGTVFVTEDERSHLLLRGPADLVARGTVLLP